MEGKTVKAKTILIDYRLSELIDSSYFTSRKINPIDLSTVLEQSKGHLKDKDHLIGIDKLIILSTDKDALKYTTIEQESNPDSEIPDIFFTRIRSAIESFALSEDNTYSNVLFVGHNNMLKQFGVTSMEYGKLFKLVYSLNKDDSGSVVISSGAKAEEVLVPKSKPAPKPASTSFSKSSSNDGATANVDMDELEKQIAEINYLLEEGKYPTGRPIIPTIKMKLLEKKKGLEEKKKRLEEAKKASVDISSMKGGYYSIYQKNKVNYLRLKL